jgi:hypothetical protein
MRPPRKSWAFSAAAAQKLLRLVEAIAAETGASRYDGFGDDNSGQPATKGRRLVRRRLSAARKAVQELAKFVDESEECEEP